MRHTLTILNSITILLLSATFSLADVTPYSQDFEGLDIASPSALGDDGWLVGANVFDAGGNFLYNYFAFPAPNGSGAFSNIAAGEGGPDQGAQQLVTFNDYNNTDHLDFPDRIIEANFFREYTIGASDVGNTLRFSFDAKLGDLQSPSTALGFIKTLDPSNGFELTNFVTQDTTNTPTTWSSYSLELTIDSSLEGQIFQIGFLNTASNFSPSGVFYDNINLTVPEPATGGLLACVMSCVLIRRRR